MHPALPQLFAPAPSDILVDKLLPEDVREAAPLFIDCCFLAAATPVLGEHAWLIARESSDAQAASLTNFLERARQQELRPFCDDPSTILRAGVADFKAWEKRSRALAISIRAAIAKQPDRLPEFCAQMFRRLDELVRFERSIPDNFLANALDRAFEDIDQIVGIHFADELAPEVTNQERVFSGSGIGVQSSYTSLVTAFAQLAPAHGAKFIDLGSGYGRAGLALGQLRPDLECVGYEYVPHRVQMANECAVRTGVASRVSFHAQDLADPRFEIPVAQIYYLYDPFSAATYRYVLNQLREIGQRHAVVVATRGHAGTWVGEAFAGDGWLAAPGSDEGQLSLFTSRGAGGLAR